jgi:hypothetical protein
MKYITILYLVLFAACSSTTEKDLNIVEEKYHKPTYERGR